MSKLFLTEFLEFKTDSDLLTEAEKKAVQEGEEIYLAGVMQRAGATNGNGRVYSRPILEREIENYQKIVREGRAVGELDHPDSSVVELKNASHLVTEIRMDGDDVVGKIKILNTPAGKTAIGLLKGGVKLGISSRGLGSTKQEAGKTIVQQIVKRLGEGMKNNKLKTVLKPLIKECIKEIIFEEGMLSSIIREAQGASTKEIIKEEKKEKVFSKFMKKDKQENKRLVETRNKMRKAIAGKIGADFDPFEGTKPLSESQASGNPSQSPMSGIDPSNEGIDLSNIPGMGNWAAIKERLK